MGSSPNSNEHVPQPLYTQPDAFVENVYPHPLSIETPDLVSQQVAAEYLIDRMQPHGPSHRTQIIMTPSGLTLPGITREVVGTRPHGRYEKIDGWLIRPRTAVAVWAASLALFNAGSIAGDAKDEVEQGVYHLKNDLGFAPKGTSEERAYDLPFTDKPIVIKKYVKATNIPGSAEVNTSDIKAFRDAVSKAAKPGAEIDVNIVALSSDDYGTDASLGKLEPPSQDLADERKVSWSKAVNAALPEAAVHASMHQDVLTKRQINKLAKLAKKSGFEGDNALIAAIRGAESGEGSPALRKFVSKNFRRGVDLVASVQNPDILKKLDIKYRVRIPAENNPPENPNRGYTPLFLPLPWLRKRRWVNLGEKDVKRWRFQPRMQLYRPGVLRTNIDQAWLRIRQDAVKPDQTLVDDAWAYTRKYEHLLRDGRIKQIQRADITYSEVKTASLNMFYVNHDPEPETAAAMSEALKFLACMETKDGERVSDHVTGIAVIPTEYAGDHHNPKQTGLGIDKQYEENVLGVIYYPLKLIELHMPKDLKGKALQDYLENCKGAIWTLLHEAGGHGTDVAAEPLKLRKIHSLFVRNAHVFEGDPRAHRIEPFQGVLKPLADTSETQGVRMFDITRKSVDKDGNIFTRTDRVKEGDPLLAEALTATIVGHEHTHYAGENGSEHYAEIGGAATGIITDYSEPGIEVPQISENGVTGKYATGYYPDIQAQEHYAKSVGAIPGSWPLEFENKPEITVVTTSPEDDPMLSRHMIRARWLRFPNPNELIAILAQTSRRQK